MESPPFRPPTPLPAVPSYHPPYPAPSPHNHTHSGALPAGSSALGGTGPPKPDGPEPERSIEARANPRANPRQRPRQDDAAAAGGRRKPGGGGGGGGGKRPRR